MTEKEFRLIADLIYDEAGIFLKEGKKTLVEARLAKRIRVLNIPSVTQYISYLESNPDRELVFLLNAISTNFTSFYRGPEHFTWYQHYIENAYAAGQRKFRIWCAASSTGQEPYTIAMATRETLRQRYADFRILATDISTEVLQRAQEGQYGENDVKGLTKNQLRTWFHTKRTASSVTYGVKDSLKGLLLFKRLNLAVTPLPLQGNLDIIFCRNVMIYFDDAVRRRVVAELYRLLKPGGILFVGHSESLATVSERFILTAPAIYRKK
ncbi:MAG: CheR family methyltransferase [Fibrobacterota bacterium]